MSRQQHDNLRARVDDASAIVLEAFRKASSAWGLDPDKVQRAFARWLTMGYTAGELRALELLWELHGKDLVNRSEFGAFPALDKDTIPMGLPFVLRDTPDVELRGICSRAEREAEILWAERHGCEPSLSMARLHAETSPDMLKATAAALSWGVKTIINRRALSRSDFALAFARSAANGSVSA